MKDSFLLKSVFVCFAFSTINIGCAKMTFTPVEVELPSAIPPSTNKSVNHTEVVAYGNKQVDFLLVLDDSNSMLSDLQKLAARMETFLTSLDAGNIDWQMCLTTTRGTTVAGVDTYGENFPWSNYSPALGVPTYLLKKGTHNLTAIFNSTINSLTIGGGLSGDERAIHAAHAHFAASANHSCYRPGSAISIIVISDEDERSVGGNPAALKANDAATAYIPLESTDRPSTLVSKAKKTFGNDIRLTFSSIIVKPGDTTCEAEQDLDTSPSHPGVIYAEASNLTDGGVGSICDADYSGNLNTFKDKIVNSMSSLILECAPVKGAITVKAGGHTVSGVKTEGRILKFTYPLIEGTEIQLIYECPN